MEQTNKRYLIIGTVMILVIAVIGVTYAYWRGTIQGSGAPMSVTFDDVSIVFTDNTEILENNAIPGWSTTKTFTVENEGTIPFKYDIYIKNFLNTLVTEGYLQYKITSSNGYNMTEFKALPKTDPASDVDLAEGITVGAGELQEYTIEIRYVDAPDFDQSEDMGKIFSGQLMIRENTSQNLYTLLTNENKYEIVERIDFSAPVGGESITQGYNSTEKIYRTENDYYFAGNPSDNWVYFAEKWWRIIRTNSTDGTKILYAGTTHDGQDGYINNKLYQWYSNDANPSYVSWEYASFLTELNEWYAKEIGNLNDYYVNENIYCSDVSYTDMSGSWGTFGRKFGANIRLKDTMTPSYSCSSNSFRYEGKMEGKIGLMTADEIAFAGGVEGLNAPNTYYYRNSITNGCTGGVEDPCSVTGDQFWWTMTPSQFLGDARVYTVYGGSKVGLAGRLVSGNSIDSSFVVRPVITLKPEITVTGSGTTDDPYILN